MALFWEYGRMTRGPLPKSTARRQRRNRERPRLGLEVHTGEVPAIRPEIPVTPKSLLKVTKERWATYWNSDVAIVATEADYPTVERLHRRYDERERAFREVRKAGRLAIGSQGQQVLHPLLKYIDQCEQEIRALEDRLGLSPHARLRMGATMAGAKRTLDDANQNLEVDHDDPR